MEFPKKFWLVQRYFSIEPETLQDFDLQLDPPTEDHEGRLAVKCEVLESGLVRVTKTTTVDLDVPKQIVPEIPPAPEPLAIIEQMKKWAAATVSVPQADGDPGPESGNSDAQGCNTGRIEDAKPCAENLDRDYDIPF